MTREQVERVREKLLDPDTEWFRVSPREQALMVGLILRDRERGYADA
jgi:hypothetical protein